MQIAKAKKIGIAGSLLEATQTAITHEDCEPERTKHPWTSFII